jgi:hypothetical protein
MKIKIELETTEAETFQALSRLEYVADRIREAAALFQGKIIDEMAADFPWPPRPADDDEDLADEDHSDHDDESDDSEILPWSEWSADEHEWEEEKSESFWAPSPADSREIEEPVVTYEPEYLKEESAAIAPSTSASAPNKLDLPKLSAETRQLATTAFEDLVALWAQNFDREGEQPDRLEALRVAGSGRFAFPILVMAYETRSLQRLVEKALISRKIVPVAEALEYADKIAGNMVQICHMCFPDLAGTYDYSTKWRRE